MKQLRNICLVVLMLLIGVQSCNYIQEDVFDESPSIRLQKTLDETWSILQKPEYGWVFEMYPSSTRSQGGITFTLRFSADSVFVRSENASPTNEEASMYKLLGNNGPTLSFDTYNSLLHYYATPSSGSYEAKKGEFEFLICSVSDNEIVLKGTRTGNIMHMYPLKVPAEEYFNRRTEVINLLTKWAPTVGKDGSTITLRHALHMATVTEMKDGIAVQTEYPMAITDKGVRFYDYIIVAGDSFREMETTSENDHFGEGITENGVHFEWIQPAGWHKFEDYDFDGVWVIKCNLYCGTYDIREFHLPVTMKSDSETQTVLMTGVFEHDVPLTWAYRVSTGNIELNPQILEHSTAYPDYWTWMVLGFQTDPNDNYYTATATAEKYREQGLMLVEEPDGSFRFQFNEPFTSSWKINPIYPSIGVALRTEDGRQGTTDKPEEKWRIQGYPTDFAKTAFNTRLFNLTTFTRKTANE